MVHQKHALKDVFGMNLALLGEMVQDSLDSPVHLTVSTTDFGGTLEMLVS